MSTTAGVLHVLLGIVYAQYGTMTLVEMKRNWGSMGFSHFGAAWIAMAFTCGPHHFFHGIHILFEGRQATALDMVTVLIAAPAGLLWFYLRVEAFFGGQGDFHIAGTPLWVAALPTFLGMYLTAVVAAGLGALPLDADRLPYVLANILLVPLYAMVSYYVTRTQIANHRPLGGWSVSGLCLAVIFFSCAVMHAVGALYTLSTQYDLDPHGITIDLLGVPAAIYFVSVVRALHRGTFRDWNRVARRLEEGEPAPLAARA